MAYFLFFVASTLHTGSIATDPYLGDVSVVHVVVQRQRSQGGECGKRAGHPPCIKAEGFDGGSRKPGGIGGSIQIGDADVADRDGVVDHESDIGVLKGGEGARGMEW